MTIQLDHLIIPVPERVAAARQLGELLGVPWAAQGAGGPFSPVYVNDGLTIDFDTAEGAYPIQHYAFRVDDAAFDAILGRIKIAGVPYRGNPRGPNDMKVNKSHGGRIAYWDAPGGHVWEILTESYARKG
jgi:hypothetical protein